MLQPILLVALMAGVSPEPQADTVVVCPEPLRAAMQPWADYRTEQGHRIVWVSAAGSAAEIRQRIIDLAPTNALRRVVLVGDADPRLSDDLRIRQRCVPTHYVESKVTVRYGSEKQIASDNPYGDLSGDGLPELAVGRLAAESPEALQSIVQKIIAFERHGQNPHVDPQWQHRLNFVATAGGFGPLIDGTIETISRQIISQHIPPAYTTSMTYASWQSPYCPEPLRLRETVVERLGEGCLFWIYIGHGLPGAIEMARMPDRHYPLLGQGDLQQLPAGSALPVALLMACYTGAFDAYDVSLAEQMLMAPGGPVAVVAASRVTMPYAMSVLAMELTDAVFQQQTATLGEALLRAKRLSVERPRGESRHQMLDMLATLLNPLGGDLAAERREHVQLFNLLGDPLLRLPRPQVALLQVPASVEPGGLIEVSATLAAPIVAPAGVSAAPAGGSVTASAKPASAGHAFSGVADVELLVPRDRLPLAHTPRKQYDLSDESRSRWQAVYQQANNPRLVVERVRVENGRLVAQLRVPDEVKGLCHVRVRIHAPGIYAIGSAAVQVGLADSPESVDSASADSASSTGDVVGGEARLHPVGAAAPSR